MNQLLHAGKHVGRGLFHGLAALGSARTAPPDDPCVAAERLSVALAAIARSHDIELQVCGDIPRGRALIVANHVSYFDPVLVLPLCPALPIAKGDVAGWPIIGGVGRGLGVMFVRRTEPMHRARVLHQVHRVLAAGAAVLNFPEGTTTRGVEVAPFWRGTFGIAQRLEVPVIPVALRYRDPTMAWFGNATFLPHYWRTVRRPRVEVSIRFGSPMYPRTGEPPEAMAARARGTIAYMLQNLTWTPRWIDAGTSVRLSSPRPDPVLPAAGARVR
ncbi:MAG TPA: lysophospholipid acyltransferase family protein [Kofleriaceae bacterium]|jgi:1-acyl-sn-glycerol-3-phosphate acyltransferase|nr:lysophospholipid acyltransferase family protein [Kofleriaceae bacterium]